MAFVRVLQRRSNALFFFIYLLIFWFPFLAFFPYSRDFRFHKQTQEEQRI